MVFKFSLVVTLLALAVLFASVAGWVTDTETVDLVFKLGVLSSVVAALALLLDK